MHNAVIYCRTADANSLKRLQFQEEILKAHANLAGITIEKTFVDLGKSGANISKRAGLFGAMSYIKNNMHISALLVQDSDRLSRKMRDFFEIKKFLSSEGVELIYLKSLSDMNTQKP